MITQEQIEEIDQISKDIYEGATTAFGQLEQMRMILINVKIAVSKLGDHPEARALNQIGTILEENIIKVEDMTRGGRDASKQLGKIINTIKGE